MMLAEISLFTMVWFLVGAGLSFLMSGMEAGVMSLNRLRLRRLKRLGNRRAARLLRYLDEPENFLWTIMVGNTLANLLLFALLVMLSMEWFPGRFWAPALMIAGTTFLLFTFLDLLPKLLFRQMPNRLCLACSPVFRLTRGLLSPLVWVAEMVARSLLRWTGGRPYEGHLFGNREELRFLIQESGAGLTSHEQLLVGRVLDLQSRTVGELMIPFGKVASVMASDPVERAVRTARERNVTRLPVRVEERGRQRTVGLLNVATLLHRGDMVPGRTCDKFVHPALFLPVDMRLEEALGRMRRGGRRLAVVIGRDERELGVIALRDVLHAIFGEVRL
jgi:putative hemolysin